MTLPPEARVVLANLSGRAWAFGPPDLPDPDEEEEMEAEADCHSWTNEQLATWAAQELSHSAATFSERVEARKALAVIVKRADAYQAALYVIGRLHDALREVDPEYVGSPLEHGVCPFLLGGAAGPRRDAA